MNQRLFVLLFCLFVVNIGFGITLPVLPFYAERLALAEGASTNTVGLHVGLLTGIYALMQLLFAPVWGVWSDRVGRKPLLLLGNLSALISKLAGTANTGAALGVQSVANSLGQFVGPVLGGVLFGWDVGAPFFLTGSLLVLTGLVMVWVSSLARSSGYPRAGEKEI